MNPDHNQQIIIIRRKSDGDEDHHGGAWKIAFADFMTAMLALFLVLWLVNAANEETKKSVASYFNPVKLVDRNRSSKGLEDARGGPEEEGREDRPISKEPEVPPASPEEPASRTDAQLFDNPYGVLDEIAAEEVDETLSAAIGPGLGPETPAAADSDPTFRDPFAPDFWSQTTDQSRQRDPSAISRKEIANKPGDNSGAPEISIDTGDDEKEAGAKMTGEDVTWSGEKQSATDVAEAAPFEARKRSLDTLAAELQAEIAAKLIEPSGGTGRVAESLTVTSVDEGVLISITDQFSFPMFEIGSAVPRHQTVIAMEKISGVLTDRQGSLQIYGHTDARPFRDKGNDNWRLSSARAQSAYYMLLRSGLAEARVTQITGFADRRLKVPENPLADANRRIEILLEVQ